MLRNLLQPLKANIHGMRSSGLLHLNAPRAALSLSFQRRAFAAASTSSGRKEKTAQELEDEEAARRQRIQDNIDANMRKRQMSMLKYSLLFSVLSGIGAFIYLGRPIEGEVTDPAEGTFAGYRRRAKAGMSSTAETVTAPQFGEKLLPDPLPEPYQRPFTLVIELNEALAHLVWDKNIGWRLAARPGVKDFLAYLGKYYEIVLFADSPAV
ncbi:MAG: hypothetical protein SGCHY_004138, partial [Lobulomycetales sp.]